MAPSSTEPQKYSEQHILSQSFDESFDTLAVEGLKYNGSSLVRDIADQMAVKVTVSGSITYVAKAPPGSLQASAVWQAMKVDETTGTVITWADGNTNFDNVATDLTALTYS